MAPVRFLTELSIAVLLAILCNETAAGEEEWPGPNSTSTPSPLDGEFSSLPGLPPGTPSPPGTPTPTPQPSPEPPRTHSPTPIPSPAPPAPVDSPHPGNPSAAPVPYDSPEASGSPEPYTSSTPTPDAVDSPVQTPGPSDSPEPYDSPESTPEPTDSPEPYDSPDPELSPESTPTATPTPECEEDEEAALCDEPVQSENQFIEEESQPIEEGLSENTDEEEEEGGEEQEHYASYYAPAPFCPPTETITLKHLPMYHPEGTEVTRGETTFTTTKPERIKCKDETGGFGDKKTWEEGSKKNFVELPGFPNLEFDKLRAKANAYCKGKYSKFPIARFSGTPIGEDGAEEFVESSKVGYCDDDGYACFESTITINCERKKC